MGVLIFYTVLLLIAFIMVIDFMKLSHVERDKFEPFFVILGSLLLISFIHDNFNLRVVVLVIVITGLMVRYLFPNLVKVG